MTLRQLFLVVAVVLAALPAFAQTDPAVTDTTAVDTLSAAATSQAVPPAPVTDLTAQDTPDDHGHSITLNWTLSASDAPRTGTVTYYVIRRATDANGPFDSVGTAASGESTFEHSGPRDASTSGYLPNGTDFYYRVDAIDALAGLQTPSAVTGPVQAVGQWYNWGRTPVFVAVILFGFVTVYFVTRARRGADLYVRPLGGIEAVDEAIGRATEMGKPILYVLGLGTASDISTIASLTILGRVAKKVAEYQTELIVPTYDPIVMSVAQETVKSAYMDAGRPDSYNDDIVFFVTQNQFAYVSAINGIMLRQLPATNLYLGKFYAESLILAETGSLAGSIQISGTDEIAQIPFFVVACDYTLIGEELYAASAYLGREPVLLGSLKAQDYAKAAIIILALLGLLAMNLSGAMDGAWGQSFKDLFKVAN